MNKVKPDTLIFLGCILVASGNGINPASPSVPTSIHTPIVPSTLEATPFLSESTISSNSTSYRSVYDFRLRQFDPSCFLSMSPTLAK